MTRRPPSNRPYRRIHEPYVTHCVLCDEIVVADDGSLTIRRIIDDWRIPAEYTPPIAIQCWVAVSLRGIPKDATTARLQFVRDSDDAVMAALEADLTGVGSSVNLNVEASQIPITAFGDYRLSVIYKGREIGAYPFTVGPAQLINSDLARKREIAP